MVILSGAFGLSEGPGVVGGVMFSGAPSPVVRMSPSGWVCATLFLFDYEMGYDEVSAKEYIAGKMALMISGSDGCCSFNRLA